MEMLLIAINNYMKSCRASLIGIICCFGLEMASAQTSSDGDISIGVTTGIGFAKGTDERFSKGVQLGNPVTIGLSGGRQQGRSILSASFDLSYGDFQYSQNKAVGIFRKSTEVNLSYMFGLFIDQSKHLEFYGGVNLGLIGTRRSYSELLNNNKSYETLFPIDLKVLATYKFGPSDQFRIKNQIYFSAAGLFKQSAFGNVGTNDNSSENWELTSLTKLTRFFNQTELAFWLSQKHSIGVNYIFKNYSLTTGRNVKYLEHLVGVCYKLSL